MDVRLGRCGCVRRCHRHHRSIHGPQPGGFQAEDTAGSFDPVRPQPFGAKLRAQLLDGLRRAPDHQIATLQGGRQAVMRASQALDLIAVALRQTRRQVAARRCSDPRSHRFETGPQPRREHERQRHREDERQGQRHPQERHEIRVDRAEQAQVGHRKHRAHRAPVGSRQAEARRHESWLGARHAVTIRRQACDVPMAGPRGQLRVARHQEIA